jgi:hypothetical protein
MALAESLFVAAVLLTLIAIQRRWPLVLTAFVAGLTTATRPVGVAASAAFLWSLLRLPNTSPAKRGALVIVLAPLSCWGLLEYMYFQHVAFGNAFAFAQTQEHWSHQSPVAQPGIVEKSTSLLTLEPIVGVFDPGSTRNWQRSNGEDSWPFNLFFWNPVLFLTSAGLVIYGTCRRWLTGPESVLGAFLVAIPYVTRSYEMSMASHARFGAAVVVIYPVLGRMLRAWPAPIAAITVSYCALLMMTWVALYVSGHALF